MRTSHHLWKFGGGVPPLIAEKWWLDESIPLEDRKKIFRRVMKKEAFHIGNENILSQHYIFVKNNWNDYKKTFRHTNNLRDLDTDDDIISIILANILD